MQDFNSQSGEMAVINTTSDRTKNIIKVVGIIMGLLILGLVIFMIVRMAPKPKKDESVQ